MRACAAEPGEKPFARRENPSCRADVPQPTNSQRTRRPGDIRAPRPESRRGAGSSGRAVRVRVRVNCGKLWEIEMLAARRRQERECVRMRVCAVRTSSGVGGGCGGGGGTSQVPHASRVCVCV